MDMTHLPEEWVEPTEPDTVGALPSVDPEALQVEELEDGSAVVLGDEPEDDEDSEFDDNLAEELDESVLSSIGLDMCESVESDKVSRTERDKQYAEGIKRTGMGNEAPGGAEFTGASRAVHPMLAKGCVDFASKAIKELFPANGPCKTQIVGTSTDAKISKADRKKTYINWQLTTQVQENRAEFERLLSQLPLGGSQYKRWWHDAKLKRLRTEVVYVDDVFIPYNTNFYTSHRVTHRQYVSKSEFDARISNELYRDVASVAPPAGLEDPSAARQAAEKVEGSEEDTSAYNQEGLREIYQVFADLEVEGDSVTGGALAPYVLHVEAYSHKVLGLYRNWKQDDETLSKKHWMVEYNFIPWRGAYGVGLTHLIGSLAAASTGALRALLDSAHISNFPGGLKLKGGRNSGQSVQVNATELAEIDAPAGIDDIRKLVMAFPFNGPSAVLQTLMEWLTQQAEAVVATASEKIADGNANMPMGTALALIEQGSVNFSSIHARLHASLKKELEIVHRLNSEHLSDEETVEDLGELVVSREDFQGPVDIVPVSDPNIFSESQRYAQLQAVLQLKTDPQFAPYFKADKLLHRALKLLQFPAPEDIASLPKDPTRLSALEENYTSAAPEPSPLKVYEDQDDLTHLETHVHFMSSPMFGANPLIAPQALPALIAHCKDHLMAFYKKHSMGAAEAFMTVARARGIQITRDQAESKAAAFADMMMSQLLGPLVMPGLQAAMQMSQQVAPKPQADANTMLAESTKQALKTAELAYFKERDTADRTANQAAADISAKIEAMQNASDLKLAQFDAAVDLLKQSQAEASAKMIAEMNASAQQQLAVLNAILSGQQQATQAQATAKPAASQQPVLIMGQDTANISSLIQPMLESVISPIIQNMIEVNSTLGDQMRTTAQQTSEEQAMLRNMLQAVEGGVQGLHKVANAPRTAQFVFGPDGKKVGVRSIIEGVTDVSPNNQG